MRVTVAGNDNVQLLTGRGIEILFARGTTVAIGCFCNGELICLGGQDFAEYRTPSLTTDERRLREEPTLILKDAA